MILLVFVVQASYNFTTGGSVLGEGSNLSAERLLESTNEERVKNGLQPLSHNPNLEQAAILKAHDMLNRQYWSHSAPDGTAPWMFLDKAGYSYVAAGENLARDFNSSEATVAAWMASPEHRANLLDEDFKDVGFAVVHGMLSGRNSSVAVAFYGDPSDSGVVAGASAPITTVASAAGLSPMARLGVALQSLTPAAIGSLIVMMAVTIVALMAHTYRKKLPKRLQRSWYRHHGLIKSGGLACLAFMMVVLYGGGSL